MNREIKFRGWSPKTAKRFKPEKMFDWEELQDIAYTDGISRVFSGACFVLMQFTGLKDKNGKEIYEGDILKNDDNDLFEAKFGELLLDKSGDCVCTYPAFYAKGYGKLGSPPYYECNQIEEWMEVIGDIYSNPELLTN